MPTIQAFQRNNHSNTNGTAISNVATKNSNVLESQINKNADSANQLVASYYDDIHDYSGGGMS